MQWTSSITKHWVYYVVKHYHMSRPSHLRQSLIETDSISTETDKHPVKVFGLYRGARSDLTAIIYPTAKAGDVCLAGVLRDMLSAVAVPPDHPTGAT